MQIHTRNRTPETLENRSLRIHYSFAYLFTLLNPLQQHLEQTCVISTIYSGWCLFVRKKRLKVCSFVGAGASEPFRRGRVVSRLRSWSFFLVGIRAGWNIPDDPPCGWISWNVFIVGVQLYLFYKVWLV